MASRVFLSSTAADMSAAYRPAVLNLIQRLGGVPITMETFGSNMERGDVVSVSQVATAEVFVLLLGFRYGFVVAGQDKSITQMEYEEAYRLETIPILAYLANEQPGMHEQAARSFPPNTLDTVGDGFAERQASQRLAAFRDLVLSRHTCTFFTSPDEVCARIEPDLRRALQGGLTEGHVRLKRGREALGRGDYAAAKFDLQMAVTYLREDATAFAPAAAQARFLLAIAQLDGRRPRSVAIQTMREVHDLLLAAIRLSARSTYLIALAAIDLDFAGNGFTQYADEVPRVLDLLPQVPSTEADRADLDVLSQRQPQLMSEFVSGELLANL